MKPTNKEKKICSTSLEKERRKEKSNWKQIYMILQKGEEKLLKIILYLVAKETFLVSFYVKESFLYSWSFNGNDLNNSKNKSRKNTKYVFIVNLQDYFLLSALKCKMWNYDCILHECEAFTYFHNNNYNKKFNINSILFWRLNNTKMYKNVINI